MCSSAAAALFVQHVRVAHHPPVKYLTLTLVLFMMSVVWYRCWSALKRREQQGHDDELLWMVCGTLPLIGTFVMIAVHSLTPG